MFKQYLRICHLLESLGPFQERLDKIQQIIQASNFQYDAKSAPHILTGIFLASSYWLDQELFDDSYLYKKNQNLLAMQKAHLQLTDIGAILLDKGFSLKYKEENFALKGPNQLACYIKTFSEQCYKRRDFLQTQSACVLPRVRAAFNKERR